jgi:5-oxoprolinase (ATP-hydrolysing)
VPPAGLAGGSPGATGRNAVERADGPVEELTGVDQVEMRAGDVFVVETPGGGGYGPPDGREAADATESVPAGTNPQTHTAASTQEDIHDD